MVRTPTSGRSTQPARNWRCGDRASGSRGGSRSGAIGVGPLGLTEPVVQLRQAGGGGAGEIVIGAHQLSPELVPGQQQLLRPVEATQLMGTLGGIGELAREVLGDRRSDVTTPLDLGKDGRVGVPRTRDQGQG